VVGDIVLVVGEAQTSSGSWYMHLLSVICYLLPVIFYLLPVIFYLLSVSVSVSLCAPLPLSF
jgi:hypothetical protein